MTRRAVVERRFIVFILCCTGSALCRTFMPLRRRCRAIGWKTRLALGPRAGLPRALDGAYWQTGAVTARAELTRRAQAHGIAVCYTDWQGRAVEVTDETL